jgi:hypothetical protein
MFKSEYQVTPCYFSDKLDYITFRSGKALSVFLQNTDYDCDVKVKTTRVIDYQQGSVFYSEGLDEYGAYGENNGPLI